MTSDTGIIIVTGSNGRIGDAVMRRFADRFDGVVGFDRKAPGPPPGCMYVPVDITSDESVQQGLKAIREHHGTRAVLTSAVSRSCPISDAGFGAWFIAAPWVLGGAPTAMVWNDVAVGVALILLSLPRGPVHETYGGWNRFIA
jgi:NAD(P)-dependent dehydrogenase (short-subunit alcohol dehydrogenase family)